MSRRQPTDPEPAPGEQGAEASTRDPHLEEIRRRVAQGYYERQAVAREVADAFIEHEGERRAGGRQGKRRRSTRGN